MPSLSEIFLNRFISAVAAVALILLMLLLTNLTLFTATRLTLSMLLTEMGSCIRDETSGMHTEPLPTFAIEDIESTVNNLKSGKACRPDAFSVEHLVLAHPFVFIHLKLLFIMTISHAFVPGNFCKGIIIPFVEDKSGDFNSTDNYRPITLTPIRGKNFPVCSQL
jgi:hypothetical protein